MHVDLVQPLGLFGRLQVTLRNRTPLRSPPEIVTIENPLGVVGAFWGGVAPNCWEIAGKSLGNRYAQRRTTMHSDAQ